jgi:prevent-host-death family protein
MIMVGVHEAKTNLSRLLRRVSTGEEIVITRGGQPLARLVPVEPRGRRQLGLDDGRFEVPADFDAPLFAEFRDAFEA